MYYLCSENKGADQLRGYREDDLRLCFRICKKSGFLTSRLICHDKSPPCILWRLVLLPPLQHSCNNVIWEADVDDDQFSNAGTTVWSSHVCRKILKRAWREVNYYNPDTISEPVSGSAIEQNLLERFLIDCMMQALILHCS